jgi:carbon starvation protein CstA
MMTENLHKAEPHIIAAIRRLEMMLWFVRNNKKLAVHKHVPAYFDLITTDLAAIQDALYTDEEYTETVAKGLARVNHTREYAYSVTSNDKGEILYNVDAMLPLKEMKENVIFVRRDNQ